MTTRERVLAGVLGTFIALGLVAGVGYFLVLSPLGDKARLEGKLRQENMDKELELAKITKELPRLKIYEKRSLGADVNTAAREYNEAIRRVLRDAKVPQQSWGINPLAADAKSAPELPVPTASPNAPKPTAYTRIGLDVTLRRVDLNTVINVLKGYYKLGLLHQITKFNVKKSDEPAAGGRPAGADGSRQVADKPDLDVAFTTIALSVHGAEPRRSLLPVSPAFGAALGGLAGHQLGQSEEQARGLTPLQLAQVLAPGDRDYSAMLVKDIFHGPPPPPPKVDPPPKVVEQPKDDTSDWIQLTGIGPESNGARTAVIVDKASNQDYVITVARKDGKVVASVVKSTHTPKGERKSQPPSPELDISEETSATAMRFRVLGLSDDALVLALKAGNAPKPPAPKPAGPGGNFPGFGPKRPGGGRITADAAAEPAPEPAPAAPAAGAAGAEKVYLWRFGEPLSRIKELTGAEKDDAIKRATAGEEAPAPAVVPAGAGG